MSYMAEFRVYRLAQEKVDNWRRDHATELRQLSYQEMNQRVTDAKVRLEAEAEAEVATEEDAEARRLTTIIRSSTLAAHIRAFYVEYEQQATLTAERDARIAAIKQEYDGQITRPNDHIDAYNQGRLALLQERIAAAGLTMCSGCHTAKPDVRLVYIDGTGIGSVSDCMSTREWFEPVSELRSLCQDCRTNTNAAPRTAYAEGSGTTYQVLHATEDRSDGTYALFDGGWIKSASKWTWQKHELAWRIVPETARRIHVLSCEDSIGGQLAVEWELPPRIRNNYPGGLQIHCPNISDYLPLTDF